MGGTEGIERAELIAKAMATLRRDHERALADARLQLDQVRAELAEARQERADDARYIEELKQWGQGLAEQVQALRGELYGPEQGPAEPAMGY